MCTRMAKVKITGNIKCWRGQEQREFSCIALEMVNYFGNYTTVSYKITHSSHLRPCNPTPRVYSREVKTYVQKKTWIQMSTEDLFTIASNWKEPTCPSG